MAIQTIASYFESAALLGQRTAEMHGKLAEESDEASFRPEPFGKLYQRSLFQSMRNLVGKSFQLLRRRAKSLPESVQSDGHRLLGLEAETLRRFQSAFDGKLTGMRTRCHGDYHLGQVLWTGKDFVIIDFEGEPARSLYDRRLRRSPLRDVAGMLRSFHYAVYCALLGDAGGQASSHSLIRPEDMESSEQWASYWYQWVAATFLRNYREAASPFGILPEAEAEFAALINAFLLEKAIYELSYELNHRPDWVRIPIIGILRLLGVS